MGVEENNKDEEKTNKKEQEKRNRKTKRNKRIIIYGIIIVLIIGIIAIYVLSKDAEKNQKSDTEIATEYVKKLGKDFYETYYYPQLSELKNNEMIEDIPSFLANFKETGISVSLNVVINNHFRTKEAINETLGDFKCDFDATKVIIYPIDPYEKTSYKIAPMISCEKLSEEDTNN